MITFKDIKYKKHVITAQGFCHSGLGKLRMWRNTSINVKTGEYSVEGFSDYELEHSLLLDDDECNMFVRGVIQLAIELEKNGSLPDKMGFNWGR